jgi:hypothetical protein
MLYTTNENSEFRNTAMRRYLLTKYNYDAPSRGDWLVLLYSLVTALALHRRLARMLMYLVPGSIRI